MLILFEDQISHPAKRFSAPIKHSIILCTHEKLSEDDDVSLMSHQFDQSEKDWSFTLSSFIAAIANRWLENVANATTWHRHTQEKEKICDFHKLEDLQHFRKWKSTIPPIWYETGQITNLVAASGVLELTRLESETAPEKIVDLASLNVARQARDKESVNRPRFVGEPWQRRRKRMRIVDVVRIVRLVIRHFPLAGGEFDGGNTRRRSELTCK